MKLRTIIMLSYGLALMLVIFIVFFSVKYMVLKSNIAYIVTFIMIVACILSFIVSYLLFLPTFHSIRKLSSHSNKLATGQFEQITDIHSPKEIAELAKDFNYMTEQLEKSFRQIKKSENEKNTMVSQLSHDIKTPITSIRSQIEAIMDNLVSDIEMPTYLESIRTQVMRLNRLTDELFDFTITQENQKIKSARNKLWIDQILVEVLNSFQVQFKNENRDILIELDDKISFIYSDEEGINRILYNLIGNALKYSPPGTPIKIAGNIDNDRLQISIQDFGIGIPDEEQRNIFKRLYRVEKSRNLKYGGTGLGLYISLEVVKKLGGDIFVKSEEGKGSTFTLSLPILLEEAR